MGLYGCYAPEATPDSQVRKKKPSPKESKLDGGIDLGCYLLHPLTIPHGQGVLLCCYFNLIHGTGVWCFASNPQTEQANARLYHYKYRIGTVLAIDQYHTPQRNECPIRCIRAGWWRLLKHGPKHRAGGR